ncbi:hypothetical protein CHS0354_000283 [Potamilus streckersoni]|uniref:Uncharacterized protein n=1 Tax=Potamilus streckersoni TaxID=2493646 RepID=A0AAE0VM36_9BIVA|nr:hypothetical protein CHS0354_000283 [Potamilus streckersoni]
MIGYKDFSICACPYVRRGCYHDICGCHEIHRSFNDLNVGFQEDDNVFSIYDFSVNKSKTRVESQVDIIQKAAKTDLIRWAEGFIAPVDGYVKISKDPVVEKLSEILEVMEEWEKNERKRKRTEKREKRQNQIMRRYSYQETLNSRGTTKSPLPGPQSSGYSTDAKSSETAEFVSNYEANQSERNTFLHM